MTEDRGAWPTGLSFDEIGYWTEIKLDIVRDYAKAYSTILATKPFSYAYIDAFAGSGVHLARDTHEFVPGSPLNALRIEPLPHYGYEPKCSLAEAGARQFREPGQDDGFLGG